MGVSGFECSNCSSSCSSSLRGVGMCTASLMWSVLSFPDVELYCLPEVELYCLPDVELYCLPDVEFLRSDAIFLHYG